MALWSRRRRRSEEVDAEIKLHLDLRIDALMAAGRSRAEAEREAHARFGGVDREIARLVASARRRDRRLTMSEWARTCGEELQRAIRQIARTPALTCGVVATMALGLGVNATMYAAVVRLLFTPPPHVASVSTLLELAQERVDTRQPAGRSVSYPVYKAIRDTGSFAPLGAMSSPVEISLGRGSGASAVWALFVNAEYFRALGASPHRGRFFVAEDEQEPAGPNVAVISHAVWQRVFAANPDIVGRPIDLGRASYVVVGIAPPGFRGITLASIGIWIPITASQPLRGAGPSWVSDTRSTWLRLIGRLGPATTGHEAAARSTRAMHASSGATPGSALALRTIVLRPIRTNERGFGEVEDLRVPALIAAVSLLVLAIACTNVTHLLIARAVRRRRETAIALALGARRSRLVIRHMFEAVLLCLLGSAATLAVVSWGNALVRGTLFAGLDEGGSDLDLRLSFMSSASEWLPASSSVSAPRGAQGGPTSSLRLRPPAAAASRRRERAPRWLACRPPCPSCCSSAPACSC